MNAVTRAKIKIGTVRDDIQIHVGDTPDTKLSETIHAFAVYSDDPESENRKWSQWTPALTLNMTVNNPGAFGKLIEGKEYYLDFIPVED